MSDQNTTTPVGPGGDGSKEAQGGGGGAGAGGSGAGGDGGEEQQVTKFAPLVILPLEGYQPFQEVVRPDIKRTFNKSGAMIGMQSRSNPDQVNTFKNDPAQRSLQLTAQAGVLGSVTEAWAQSQGLHPTNDIVTAEYHVWGRKRKFREGKVDFRDHFKGRKRMEFPDERFRPIETLESGSGAIVPLGPSPGPGPAAGSGLGGGPTHTPEPSKADHLLDEIIHEGRPASRRFGGGDRGGRGVGRGDHGGFRGLARGGARGGTFGGGSRGVGSRGVGSRGVGGRGGSRGRDSGIKDFIPKKVTNAELDADLKEYYKDAPNAAIHHEADAPTQPAPKRTKTTTPAPGGNDAPSFDQRDFTRY